jgi:hypothetical protein
MMNTFYPTISALDLVEIRRYAGLSPVAEFSETMLKEAARDALLLIRPQGIWEIYDYDDPLHTVLSPVPLTLQGTNVQHHLAGAVQIALLAVTIGSALEEDVTHLFSANAYTAALLLDAAGTTAVEQATDAVCRIIRHQAATAGLTTNERFSPGYGDWDISVQQEILELSYGSQLGLMLTAADMLVPRKSVTAVIGLYPEQNRCYTVDSSQLGCATCDQSQCLARKETSRHDTDL